MGLLETREGVGFKDPSQKRRAVDALRAGNSCLLWGCFCLRRQRWHHGRDRTTSFHVSSFLGAASWQSLGQLQVQAKGAGSADHTSPNAPME